MPSNTKGRGVLPVTAAQTRKPFKQQQPRPPAPRLRLIIRRLPPGLTEVEFWECIGGEWQVGKGKIDWAAFKAGKISKDLAKPSRPGRAYLRIRDLSFLDELSLHVRSITFQDAKKTTTDSCLIGPPSLEFAPYNKTPHNRVRHDGRQGTIDQDPEFIDFLQSLTEAATKSAAEETAVVKEKPTTTPLVQYIKDKKANKAKEKEAATAKASSKKDKDGKEVKEVKEGKDAKDGKENKTASPLKAEQTTIVKKANASDAEKVRVAKATQQAMDSIKKSVAEIKGQVPTKQEAKAAEKKEVAPAPSTPKKERQRGDASAAARIIGRDLGLTPKEGRTPRSQRVVTTPAPVANATPAASTPASVKPAPVVPAVAATQSPSTPVQPPTGPRSLRNMPQQAQPRPSPAPQPPRAKPIPQPSPGAKSAFLKHANPSQGVTEELLRQSFSVYGTLTRCEIDKKKGLGYIDFTDTEALKSAMAASPVKIGSGSVIVLENRTPYRKASQLPSRSTPTPTTSSPSSPKLTQASLASISERAGPASTVEVQQLSGVQYDVTQPEPTTIDVAASPNNTTDAVVAAPIATAGQAVPPSAPRGNRGGQRGQFRGRGFRGGRGGPFRGGNRAVSSPNPGPAPAGAAQSIPPVPQAPDGKT